MNFNNTLAHILLLTGAAMATGNVVENKLKEALQTTTEESEESWDWEEEAEEEEESEKTFFERCKAQAEAEGGAIDKDCENDFKIPTTFPAEYALGCATSGCQTGFTIMIVTLVLIALGVGIYIPVWIHFSRKKERGEAMPACFNKLTACFRKKDTELPTTNV